MRPIMTTPAPDISHLLKSYAASREVDGGLEELLQFASEHPKHKFDSDIKALRETLQKEFGYSILLPRRQKKA